MNSNTDSLNDLEEVEKILFEIELKYAPEDKGALGDAKKKEGLEEVLAVLSKEFDCLGLPTIDLDKPELHILQQVAITARSLVQIYRSAVGEIKDKNIENRKKESKKNELYCRLDESKLLLEKAQDKFCLLQNKVQQLTQEISELKSKENYFKEELEKTKRYYASKQNELQHNLRKVRRDNDQLKEICKQDITTPNTTNEVALKLLKKYRTNEEILKSTIQKLQNNNQELLQELLNLKEDLILYPTCQPHASYRCLHLVYRSCDNKGIWGLIAPPFDYPLCVKTCVCDNGYVKLNAVSSDCVTEASCK